MHTVNYQGYSNNLKAQVVNFVPNILEMSSVLHVTLIVSLRFYAILKPTSYRKLHIKMRFISLLLIWTSSFFLHGVIVILAVLNKKTYAYTGNMFVFYCFNALPVLIILILYLLLIWILKNKRPTPINDTNQIHMQSAATEEIEKRMTTIVKRIIIVVILCYGPFVIWRQYFYVIVDKR